MTTLIAICLIGGGWLLLGLAAVFLGGWIDHLSREKDEIQAKDLLMALGGPFVLLIAVCMMVDYFFNNVKSKTIFTFKRKK